MIRKTIISVLLGLSVVLFFIAHRYTWDSDAKNKAQKVSWVSATDVFLVDLIAEGSAYLEGLQSSDLSSISQTKWSYFKRENGKISIWTSNEWMPDSSVFSNTKPRVFQHKTGWELIIPHPDENAILSYTLTRTESGQFQAENHITPLQGQQFEFQYKETEYALQNNSVFVSFYGRSVGPVKSGNYYLVAILLLILAAFLSFQFWLVGVSLAAAITLVVRILSFHEKIGHGLATLGVFDPIIFASSNLLPSLGDLALHICTALITALGIVHVLRLFKFTKPAYVYIAFGLTAIFGFFSADLIRSLLRSLIANSNISFDVTHLSTITVYTVLAVFWCPYYSGFGTP